MQAECPLCFFVTKQTDQNFNSAFYISKHSFSEITGPDFYMDYNIFRHFYNISHAGLQDKLMNEHFINNQSKIRINRKFF